MQLITLPDGFNGHSAQFDPTPIERDGNLIKLRCVDTGREHCIRWVHIEDYEKALAEVL